jgi:hypothetical protein
MQRRLRRRARNPTSTVQESVFLIRYLAALPEHTAINVRSHCLSPGRYSRKTVVSSTKLPPDPKAARAVKAPKAYQLGEAPAQIAKSEQLKSETLKANRRPITSAPVRQGQCILILRGKGQMYLVPRTEHQSTFRNKQQQSVHCGMTAQTRAQLDQLLLIVGAESVNRPCSQSRSRRKASNACQSNQSRQWPAGH